MRARNERTPRWGLGAIIGLLLVNLFLSRPGLAQIDPPACAGGYVLWANGQGRAETLVLSGSKGSIIGTAHSNADLRISGSNNRISGAVEYVTSFEDGGDSNSYLGPAQVAAAAPPLSYLIADYRPGGAAAMAAQSAGRYTAVSGDLDISDTTVLDGLYYVGGNAKLSASNISGAATIVAEGTIDVSGSLLRLTPYAGGLLLFANKADLGASVIKLGGSDSELQGAIYGPGGRVELSGSKNTLAGLILGAALALSGSELQLAPDGEGCGDQPAPPDSGLDGFAPDEVVVKLFSAADLQAVALAHGLDPQPLDQFGARPIFRLRILDGVDPKAKAAELQPPGGSGGDSRVEYAEPNYFAQTPEGRKGRGSWVVGGDAGGYAQQWAPATIRLPQAHTISRGAGITVAVLDTGIDLSHPALADRLVPGFDFVDYDADPREAGVYGTHPGFGHGTHVAGLVALAAPEAKIMPVRVLDADGAGNIWVLSEGLLFAAELGPDGQPSTGDEAQVINLSLGTMRETRLLEDLVAELTCDDDDDDDEGDDDDRCLTTGGVVVVASAGNGGDTVPQYPAAEAVAGSLAIGASTPADTRADFSTYGPWVSLAAPGEAVISTVPGGGYGTWSGTSMAAPLAAGTAALVRSAEPDVTAIAVAQRLLSTADPISGAIPWRLDAATAVGFAPAVSANCGASCRIFLPYLARM
jgi:thermitase